MDVFRFQQFGIGFILDAIELAELCIKLIIQLHVLQRSPGVSTPPNISETESISDFRVLGDSSYHELSIN